MSTSQSDAAKLKEKILDAAENRFLTFGYGKTTMAEISKDVGMSAANLYRYFQNKQDIAAECAERCMSNRNIYIREAVHQPSLSAGQQLHVFALESYRSNTEDYKKQPKTNELVEFICNERSDLVREMINKQCSLIAEILAHGNQTNEFQIIDIIKTARTLYSALIMFNSPFFLHLFTEEEFEKMAKNIVSLLIEGLKKH